MDAVTLPTRQTLVEAKTALDVEARQCRVNNLGGVVSAGLQVARITG